MLFLNLLVAAFTLVMLARHGPRAILFVAPRAVRVTGDADAPARTIGQVLGAETLAALGFRRLGLRRERSPLGGLDMEVDAWAHPDGTCADVYPAAGREPIIAFVTAFGDGFQLGTSNFRRYAVESAAGRVGGLAGAALEGTLAAHRKAAAPLAAEHGAPAPVGDLEGRLAIARRYFAGIGAVELRRPTFLSLLNALLALVLLASSVKLALRAVGLLK
jgi:hypothetical protein